MGDHFPQNCPFSWRDLDSHLIHDSLDHYEPSVQSATRSVQLFSHRWPQSVLIVYKGRPIFLKLPLPMQGSGTPSNTWFLGPIRAHNPNGSSIGLAVFAQMTANCSYILQWDAPSPLKIVSCHWRSGPHLIMVLWDHPTPQPIRHLDRFSRFCSAH